MTLKHYCIIGLLWSDWWIPERSPLKRCDFLCYKASYTVHKTFEAPMIPNAMTIIWRHINILMIRYQSRLWPGTVICTNHDNVIKWKYFPRYWPFVRGIHRSPVNSLHKGQWRWALIFSLICAWINGWVNNHGAGDWRRHRAHYDVTIMMMAQLYCGRSCTE